MSSEFAAGFFVMGTGAYLVDCAVQNRGPIATLKAIIADPTDVKGALASTKGAYPSAPPYLPPPGDQPGGNPSGGGPGSGQDRIIQGVIAFARAQIGKPYQWGATGPNSYDCSGLCYAAYRSQGISIPRTTYGMLAGIKYRVTSLSQVMPGDLVFPYPGHVFLAIGGNQMIEAPHTGTVVHQAQIYKFWTGRRVI